MIAHNVTTISNKIQTCKMLVMTSQINHNDTLNFFENHQYFGASKQSFIFFPQAVLPAVDQHGKIILEAPDKIVLAPNGNGALFDAVTKCEDVG